MRPRQIVKLLSLFVAAAAQNVTSLPEQASSSPLSEDGIVVGGFYTTTVIDRFPPYTVYECEFEAENHDGGWSMEEECEAISTVTALPSDILTVVPSSTVEKRHMADRVSVFEARMERKFGVEARSIPESIGNRKAPVLPGIVTVTSTTTILSIDKSCLSPSLRSFPVFHDIPGTATMPAAEITAMSMVASMLTKDIAAPPPTATPPQSASNVISVMVSILTANASTMVTSTSMHNGSMTVTSASLISVAPAPLFTAESDGTDVKVGAFAVIIAAVGIACLLV